MHPRRELSTSLAPAPWQRAALGANLLAPDATLGVTIFEEMTTLAVQTGAINLGQGFPDEDGPLEIREAARDAIAAGANQYAPGKGLPGLRPRSLTSNARGEPAPRLMRTPVEHMTDVPS